MLIDPLEFSIGLSYPESHLHWAIVSGKRLDPPIKFHSGLESEKPR